MLRHTTKPLTNIKITRLVGMFDEETTMKKMFVRATAEITNVVAPMKIRRFRKFAYIKTRQSSFSGHHKSTAVGLLFKGSPLRRLSAAYKKHSGRNSTGAITVYSKGHNRKRSCISYAKSLNMLKGVLVLGHVCRDVQSHKVAILCANAAGIAAYIPTTWQTSPLRTMLGAEIAFLTASTRVVPGIFNYRMCECVGLLKFYNSVCFIATKVTSQVTLARASGSSASTLVRRSRLEPQSTPIKLPSGAIKLVESAVIVLLGAVLPAKKKSFKNTRAGYWRNLGHKPTVRGIVKNPVDHPHGGRAKTVLWQRSPWGKSTK